MRFVCDLTRTSSLCITTYNCMWLILDYDAAIFCRLQTVYKTMNLLLVFNKARPLEATEKPVRQRQAVHPP